MKTKNLITTILLTFSLFLLYSLSFAQWQPQTSGTNEDLKSICFTDTLNGWVAGTNGIILHTNDGGNTWEEQISGTSNNLLSIYFADPAHGWVVEKTQTFPYYSTLHRTTNGGDNWEEIELEYFQSKSIYFIDTLNGWGVGESGILHTADGGVTWETQFDVLSFKGGISFTDSLNGWVAGSYMNGSTGFIDSFILHTNDGGDNWDYQFYINQHWIPRLFSIYFTDTLNGWAAGGFPNLSEIILKTTDGGENWDTAYLNYPGSLHSIYFANANNGLAVGYSGSILYTSDGGYTWIAESSGTPNKLTGVYFAENGYSWAVGFSGTILHADYSQTVGLDEDGVQSVKSDLRCSPNPFTTSTTIAYELQQPTTVQITIYTQLGKQLEVIHQNQSSGKQQVVWNAEVLPTGIYFCVLKTSEGIQTKKIVKL